MGLTKFFLLLSFLCRLSLSHNFLLDLGPQRLLIPLMPFFWVLEAISLPLFRLLLLPRSLTSAEAVGPSRGGAPKLRSPQQIFSLQSPSHAPGFLWSGVIVHLATEHTNVRGPCDY